MAQAITEVAGETVKLMKAPVSWSGSPRIVEGTVSKSGKTISVPDQHGPDMRLDAEKIMSGEHEYRNSYSLSLYDKDSFIHNQEMNFHPVPGEGSSHVSSPEDLPSPTHEPIALSPDSAKEDM